MKDVQDLGFLKLAVWNLIVGKRSKLAGLDIQYVHKEFLEDCIRL